MANFISMKLYGYSSDEGNDDWVDPNKRVRLDEAQRLRIFQRDGYRCVICGSRKNKTIDHKIAVYNGGTNEDDNLQTLCQSCNIKKGSS